jgi:hypothetical protein
MTGPWIGYAADLPAHPDITISVLKGALQGKRQLRNGIFGDVARRFVMQLARLRVE